MDPTPPSKRRRSSSPSNPPRSAVSPSRPVLPPPTPSSHAQPGAYPTFGQPPPSAAAGPSWQPWSTDRDREAERARAQARRSMDARSPVSDIEGGRMEGIDEGSESGMVYNKDNGGRQPRSMMACTRCRRQKMKCDGPGQLPCRGCRAAGQPCIFESRSRPKSISTLPSRAPSFQPMALTRPGSPTPLPLAGPSGSSGFYPSHSQPAPPITSRGHPPPSDPFVMRSAREPLPPAPPSSLAALASSTYVSRGHSPSASMSAIPTMPTQQPYYNPPIQIQPIITRPVSPTEARWRNVEGSLRSLQSLPNAIGSLTSTLTYLQRSTDAIFSAVSARPITATSALPQVRAREVIPDISELAWNSYRSSAWPLTPWLVGLREPAGLAGLVVAFLGRRTMMDRSEQSRRDCDEAAAAVHAEIGRLMGDRVEWTREEIRSLGVFATWMNDGALVCLSLGQARMQGLDKISAPRKTHDDWREWIYLSLMDKLSHVTDFALPVSNDSLAQAWRERLNASASLDPAVRDRDLKLLGWLEYAEYLVEILRTHYTIRSSQPMDVPPAAIPGAPPGSRPETSGQRQGDIKMDSQVRKVLDTWKKWGGRWENWALAWSVRSDPILSLHYSYAVLFTLSPVFLCSQSIWTELASTHEGFQHLERARDAAFAVIKAICSPEVSRTLPFSFALFRPLLGLAIHTLTSLHIALPNSPIISATHLTSVMRSTQETILAASPLDMASLPPAGPFSPVVPARASSVRPSSRSSRISTTERAPTSGGAAGSVGGTVHGGEGSLLREMVDGGFGRGREVWGAEPGRELWRRLLG